MTEHTCVISCCAIPCDRPTLGAYLRRDEVATRRSEWLSAARWRLHRSLGDHRTRHAAERRLHSAIEGLVRYRRLDAIADDLRTTAADLERAQVALDRGLASADAA